MTAIYKQSYRIWSNNSLTFNTFPLCSTCSDNRFFWVWQLWSNTSSWYKWFWRHAKHFWSEYFWIITYLGIQIFRFYFKCTNYSAELTTKTDPQNSDYVVELGASRNFEPWRAKDEEADKEKQKRETEEMGDAMKSLENRTLDSKREMDILVALG
ncbi:splicing factor YJU2-like isoform X2 [Camellia sinensis]|uniref:splicing factor YJU2-like isoform X2 n=1 Tax=Camellia sinensis TaxID=4442 RepID=UPI0010368747|nr:splicing factor YJU2-like isoform X2 [Camellia sinensis]